MDLTFTQTKLTKQEWDFLEVPVSSNEKNILKLIYNSYDDTNNSYNINKSILNITKLPNENNYHYYLYDKYFKTIVEKYTKDKSITYDVKSYYNIGNINKLTEKQYNTFISKYGSNITIKKADMIRIQTFDKNIETQKENIFEFIIIDKIKKLITTKNDETSNFDFNYYTLYHILNYNIQLLNPILVNFACHILYEFKTTLSMENLIYNAYNYIEKNYELNKYKDIELYQHQKDIYNIFNSNSNSNSNSKETPTIQSSKLVLYQAPTGTGKTITPVGLTKEYAVIFVCAAKHIGLQLAKACISLEIPIAIAFGCNKEEDIRLHYYAAKDFVKNYKTGGIFKVDNTNGTKVKLIVSDVQSYLYTVDFMKKFNKTENIITYWDEPTISLDYDTHEFHHILQKNWFDNTIPNMVLSSATLPNEIEIHLMIDNYCKKFKNTQVYNIISHDCNKTIPIVNTKGYSSLPHNIYDNIEELQQSISHCKNYKTIMRHFDVKEIIEFAKYVNNTSYIKDSSYKINNYFNVDDLYKITPLYIKQYYIKLLSHIIETNISKPKQWEKLFKRYKRSMSKYYESTKNIITSDAYTITDGPTIYLADDVNKIATKMLDMCSIDNSIVEKIATTIEKNNNTMKQIESIDKKLKEMIAKIEQQTGNEDAIIRNIKSNTNIKKMEEELDKLYSNIKSIKLPEKYRPNTKAHLYHQGIELNKLENQNLFKSNISNKDIEYIMQTSVDSCWKVLLLLGIGVFKEHSDTKYSEIMKKLAINQELFMIIASTDYIYGTNYQFCHGYIAKDLIKNLTQEKLIQSFGRVGRNHKQQDYSIRICDNSIMDKIFKYEKNKKEVYNMNALFSDIELIIPTIDSI